MNKLALSGAVAATAILLSGCFGTGAKHRPIVDGSDPEKYETDLTACQDLARQRTYVNEETKLGVVIGAAAGAVIEGAAAGGVVGAAVNGVGTAMETHRERKAIVINCMAGRGHKVLDPKYMR